LVTRSHALPKPPKGWAYAWKDDRLNPLRGVGTPQGQAQQDMVWQQTIPMVLVTEAPPQTAFQHALGLQNRVPVAQVTTRASTMSAAPARKPSTQKAAPVVQVAATPAAPQASGSYLIQVGSFAQASNAQAVIARLSSLGLPVSTAKTTRKGKALQVVYAGPFSSGAEASSGLTTVHGAGYSDAFLR
jgi:cell division septation protein DedD